MMVKEESIPARMRGSEDDEFQMVRVGSNVTMKRRRLKKAPESGSAATGASSSARVFGPPPDVTIEVIPDTEEERKEMLAKHVRKSMSDIFRQVVEEVGAQGMLFRRADKEDAK